MLAYNSSFKNIVKDVRIAEKKEREREGETN